MAKMPGWTAAEVIHLLYGPGFPSCLAFKIRFSAGTDSL